MDLQGYVTSAELSKTRTGINTIHIRDNADREMLLSTYERNVIGTMNEHAGDCYLFSYYKHSYIVPNVFTKW